MLNWAQQFNIFCFLDNQAYTIGPQRYECVLAAGAAAVLNPAKASFTEVDAFLSHNRWTFGHLSYDLGLPWYGLSAPLFDTTGFPHFSFFQPIYLFRIEGNYLYIEGPTPDAIYATIAAQQPQSYSANIHFQPRHTREAYIEIVKKLQQHIQAGDCYEINFCQDFFSEQATLDPIAVFGRLMEVSPNPFSALYKLHDSVLLCASPERFLHKQGSKLISQPIKGTHKRVLSDKEKDNQAKEALWQSAKDRSENVMVVDLVRNDLSKVCKEGTVVVDELYGIYAFPQVYQMISTVSGELLPETAFSDVIQATFPMGSMTGAPKKKVMELIQQYEAINRGIFSGAVGYVNPKGDFDFNVVIRSLMYNASTGYLSYQVGSGITIYSDPELEWEECLLKAEAIKKVLTR